MAIRIGVLSDTHLNKVTKEFEEIHRRFLAGMDIILHLGDFVSAEVVDFLNGDHFHGVHGNMDPGDVRERLPKKKIFKCGSFRIGLIHGWGPAAGLEARIRPEFEGVDVIAYGHSHMPADHKKEGILFFNPGTATGYNKSVPHTIGILEIDDTIERKIIKI
jgi:putative phosphoesterase